LLWCLLVATPSSSLNINDGNKQWHHYNSDNDKKKKESFEKQSLTEVEE